MADSLGELILNCFSGDVFVDLGLYSTESKKVFVSKQVGFYSCSAIKG